MTQQEMIKKLQEISFTLVELNLYLDTHPDCQQALTLYNTYAQQQKELREFLYSIIMELQEKQLKRFYAYYVLRMKLKDIARIEGTDAAAVLWSVQKSEKTIRKKIKNFLED